ncbi:hypothetical protein [Couchioplanes azureus]|uniref:hypothetical protein n=1 Tax=Couchioplanes caeruleus TaxID=56438 RepID=UPI0019B8A399|nr:hypothetical protein [Couchioplanes caeruleus]GGQ50529.1 hypothetical protein GCM10010166_18880 [Couchioplanes caeruleus subsp. azureus]
MSSGSGSDPHMLALLRAMRLRAAAPDAAAAGERDAAAALAGRARDDRDEQDRDRDRHGRDREARSEQGAGEPVHPESILHPQWPVREDATGRSELPSAHPFRELSAPGIAQPGETEHLGAVRDQGAGTAGGFRASVGPVPSGPRLPQAPVPGTTPRGPVPSTPAPDTSGTEPAAPAVVPGTTSPGFAWPVISPLLPAATPPSAPPPDTTPPGAGDPAPARSPGAASPAAAPPDADGPAQARTPGVTSPGVVRPGQNPAAPRVPATDVDPGHLMDLLPEDLTRPAPTRPLSATPLPGAPPVNPPAPAAGPAPPVPGAPTPPPVRGFPVPPPVPGTPAGPGALPPIPLAPAAGPGATPPAVPGAPAAGPGATPPAVPGTPATGPGSRLPALPPAPGVPPAVPGGSLPVLPPVPGTRPVAPGVAPPPVPGTWPAVPGAPAPGASGPAVPPAAGLPAAAPGSVPAAPPRRPTIPYPPGPGPWAAGIPGASTDPIGAIPAVGGPRVAGPAWQGDVPPIAAPPPVRPPVAGRPAVPVDGMDPADDAELHAVQRLLISSLELAGGQVEVATRLRAALVQAEPALFARIPGGPLAQIEQLAEGLAWLAQHTDQPPALVAGFGRLGAALAECGVAPQQLQLAGAALAEAMRAGMAANGWRQDFDHAWRSTWQHAYQWIAHGMVAAQYQPVTWTAVVVSHERRREDLAVVRLRPYLPMPYWPGQFARVEVPELPGVWRPYSLAGAPRRDNVVELHVRAKSLDGVSGTLVHRTQPGDKVKIWRAEGRMTLPPSGRDLLMIAGDTGIAPLKALLTELAETGDPRSAVLFWGARTLEELYDIDEITAIAGAARRATVVPVISEGPAGPYASGLVTDAVAAYGEWSGHEVFLAGPPLMLAATAFALHQLGVAPERIHHDRPE